MKKYLFVFILTILIFIGIFDLTNRLNQKKISYIQKDQDSLALDIFKI